MTIKEREEREREGERDLQYGKKREGLVEKTREERESQREKQQAVARTMVMVLHSRLVATDDALMAYALKERGWKRKRERERVKREKERERSGEERTLERGRDGERELERGRDGERATLTFTSSCADHDHGDGAPCQLVVTDDAPIAKKSSLLLVLVVVLVLLLVLLSVSVSFSVPARST